jgi:hypothetical protein
VQGAVPYRRWHEMSRVQNGAQAGKAGRECCEARPAALGSLRYTSSTSRGIYLTQTCRGIIVMLPPLVIGRISVRVFLHGRPSLSRSGDLRFARRAALAPQAHLRANPLFGDRAAAWRRP